MSGLYERAVAGAEETQSRRTERLDRPPKGPTRQVDAGRTDCKMDSGHCSRREDAVTLDVVATLLSPLRADQLNNEDDDDDEENNNNYYK